MTTELDRAGWAVTLAMLQRGDLSLHAATVRIGDEVVAIAGDRGAGSPQRPWPCANVVISC